MPKPPCRATFGVPPGWSAASTDFAMKVTVERAQLLKSLGHVHRVVERRNTIPDPRQRAGSRRQREASLEGHRPRSRSDGNARRRNRNRRLDHGAGAYVLRHRAQAARRRADRAGRRRRPLGAGDPRRPLALHAADAAGKRFSRSRRRRHDAFVHARGRRPEAADRPDPVRDLDRRDPLLSQRHLSARRRHRQGADVARGRDRRPSPGPDRPGAAEGRRRHARRDRAAQDRRRSAAPDRGQRGRGRRSSCRRARSASPSAMWC